MAKLDMRNEEMLGRWRRRKVGRRKKEREKEREGGRERERETLLFTLLLSIFIFPQIRSYRKPIRLSSTNNQYINTRLRFERAGETSGPVLAGQD